MITFLSHPTIAVIAPYIAVLASFVGLWAAYYIYRTKRAKTKLICPLHANCDKVVHSTHATTLGIPNELLGIAYYLMVALLYSLTIWDPALFATSIAYYLILFLTLVGAIFSLYLIALQAVVIRAWCSWCLLSALATGTLCTVLMMLPLHELLTLLASHRVVWVIIHNIGFILGVGAATITDVLFFSFLKDHQISDGEKETLEKLTGIIWVGLGILVISGLMLFLPAQAQLAASPKFLLKVIVVGVIIVNGIALNLFVSPRMRTLSFEGTKPARSFRRLAFALGAISIVSWYTAFVLGSIRHIGVYSLAHGLIAYGAVLFGAVLSSQVFERRMVRQYHALPEQEDR